MNWRRILTDSFVEKRYVNSGVVFGDAASYSYLGESVNIESLLDSWQRWEEEYARRGFTTISLDDFIALGGYGVSLGKGVLGRKRELNEEVALHSVIYRKNFLGKIKPAIDMDKLLETPQGAEYVLPSTL